MNQVLIHQTLMARQTWELVSNLELFQTKKRTFYIPFKERKGRMRAWLKTPWICQWNWHHIGQIHGSCGAFVHHLGALILPNFSQNSRFDSPVSIRSRVMLHNSVQKNPDTGVILVKGGVNQHTYQQKILFS